MEAIAIAQARDLLERRDARLEIADLALRHLDRKSQLELHVIRDAVALWLREAAVGAGDERHGVLERQEVRDEIAVAVELAAIGLEHELLAVIEPVAVRVRIGD